jgi:hypothetical protein
MVDHSQIRDTIYDPIFIVFKPVILNKLLPENKQIQF